MALEQTDRDSFDLYRIQTTKAPAPPTKIHILKSWPQFFQPIKNGTKLHDLRKIDPDNPFKVGDHIHLKEYDPVTGEYTGETQNVIITFITSNTTPCAYSSAALDRGYAILSIRLEF